MTKEEIQYRQGIPAHMREQAAALYDAAFGEKFCVAVKDKARRLPLLAASLLLPFSFSAVMDDKLVGLAGFHTSRGALTSGMSLGLLVQHLGWIDGLRAGLVFSLFERRPQASELLMDGIAVDPGMRGKGIGTHLLDDLKDYARTQGFSQIRLDVIDTNPAARRLYERQGFEPTKTEHFDYLRRFLGFGAATTMIFNV